MKRSLALGFAVSCLVSLPAYSTPLMTEYAACFIIYGDNVPNGRPIEVTPIAKVTMPTDRIALTLTAEFEQHLNKHQVRRYRARCASAKTVDELKKTVKRAVGMSGYGGKWFNLKPETVFPVVFDRVYEGARNNRYKPVTRSDYSYTVVGPLAGEDKPRGSKK